MKLLSKLDDILGFTAAESRVLLFLVAAFVLGIGIKVYKSAFQGTGEYNYAAADSEFAARSRMVATGKTLDLSQAISSASSERENNFKGKKIPAGKIDINVADKSQLTTLPGVGPATAERILSYRRQHGSFRSAGDLLNVKGIGKKKLEKILPYIMIGN